ncbi:22694_t:CDS:2 [Rhizophagus irregularis]|nr:22694_t:CDS:2 [Rhizophagus irregularis]
MISDSVLRIWGLSYNRVISIKSSSLNELTIAFDIVIERCGFIQNFELARDMGDFSQKWKNAREVNEMCDVIEEERVRDPLHFPLFFN